MEQFRILPLVQVNPDQDTFDVEKIRSICAHGLDECAPEDRAIAWLVLSEVFPNNPSLWAQIREEKVETYKSFINDFGLADYETRMLPNNNSITEFGLPRNDLMEIIHGDIVRSSHHILFFPCPEDIPYDNEEDILNPYYKHMRRLERILYIFGCLNPTTSYMQGFHELCSVFYYVFSQAGPYFNDNWIEIESTVFYTFQQLFARTKLSELYTTQDKSSIIHKKMAHFMEILKLHIPSTHDAIVGHRIDPLFFAFRWLNLLFSQEYQMPDIVRIWDSLFAHFDQLIEFAIYLAVARVELMGDQVDAEDYIKTMTALQKLKVPDVTKMLRIGNRYWIEDHTEKKDPLTKFLEFFQQ